MGKGRGGRHTKKSLKRGGGEVREGDLAKSPGEAPRALGSSELYEAKKKKRCSDLLSSVCECANVNFTLVKTGSTMQ